MALVGVWAAIIGGLIIAGIVLWWAWPTILLAASGEGISIAGAEVAVEAEAAGEIAATEAEIGGELAETGSIKNVPEIINGRSYSGHALDQMEERGLTPTIIDNTIETGETFPGRYPDTTAYYDKINKVTVIVNKEGRVITAHKGFPSGVPKWMR